MLGGCLKTVGCATLLVVGAGVAWLTRDRWYPALRDGHDRPVVEAVRDPLSDAGAERAASAIASLGRPSGQAYVNIAAADLASLIVREASRRNPLPLKNASAGVLDDRLLLRGTLDIRQLRAQGALGALGALLGDEEDVELRGTLDIVRSGLAEFRVEDFKARNLAIPRAAIPRLIAQLSRSRAEGVADNGVPFEVPPHIGDVRISNGRVTLYKTVAR
jgi:hypothetical protein